MTCSQCWTSAPAGAKTCPRCGAAITGAPPSFKGLFKAYPWLAAVLALSVLVTLWAATRRPPPPPEPIAPAAEPVAESPAPAPEAESEPEPAVAPAPESEAAHAPAAVLPTGVPSGPPAGKQREDGTWEPGPGAPMKPSGT
jgi:hypothetical protein